MTAHSYMIRQASDGVLAEELHRRAAGIFLTREQIEQWVGHRLADDDIARLAACIPNSSIPEAIETIAHEALNVAVPDDEPEPDIEAIEREHAYQQEGECSQCGPGHDRGDGRCERHGKIIPNPTT